MSKKFLDLVIAGPDMSGTGTQINDLIKFFQTQGMVVKDLRGTETDALFHAEEYLDIHKGYTRLSEAPIFLQRDFVYEVHKKMSGGGTNQDLKVSSCERNEITTYINPNSADVWVMEEPTKRGAGQVNRVLEQNRSQFRDKFNPISATFTHQVYRTDEFLRFRRKFREEGKIILRSRSEESACYQIFDKQFLPEGIKIAEYLLLPGHEIAFKNAPTNIFVVCAPEDWTVEQYLEMKKERSNGRLVDDYEANANYQVLVNRRYASDWLEKSLYRFGCNIHGGKVPEITRFNIYDSKEEIKTQMKEKVSNLLEACASESSNSP